MKKQHFKTHFSVLVIDTLLTARKSLQTKIESRGYRFLKAISLSDGLNIIYKHSPEIIILDLEMLDGDGFEYVKEIKKTYEGSRAKVFVLSDFMDPNIINKAFKAGCSEFVCKPYVSEDIVQKMDFWIDSIRSLEHLNASESLMNQYKNIIDESVIVSKSDANGIITYANAEFCKISGYELNELVGKSHNIIRHPDVDKKVFRDMWKSLKSGKKWRGIVKNRAKDGSTYWVKAVINPLFNSKGEIVEYIAVRDDITEMMEMKERLQHKLNSADEDLLRMFNLAQDYEKAIEESNIVTRTDLDGKITYANSSFYDVTEFEEKDVIGSTHSLFHSDKTPKSQIKNIWDTIKTGEAYKGIIRNKTKGGGDIWLNTTITPIKDIDGKPREYMAIRHDVTSLIELQMEFERTQRDILYRLGEIGETRNKETGSHVKRVAEYSKALAKLIGLSNRQIELLYAASPMHDIGKIGIPDAILLKPGKLDAEEWKIMQSHTLIGHNILDTSNNPALKAAATISVEHHEKYNGKGYPHGIKGKKIHIFSRITAIADVFDALGSDRPYKKGWNLDEIFSFFEKEKGEHFDPVLTDLFLGNKAVFLDIREKYKD